eukprot:jgi/Mesvir1/21414/Mv25934-RA.1
MRGFCVQDDWTPLHYAAYKGHVDIVKHLVASGAKKDAKTKVSFSSTLMVPSGFTSTHVFGISARHSCCRTGKGLHHTCCQSCHQHHWALL